MSENTSARKPKGRSPAYPAISLETAIQRARQLYEKNRHYATPVTMIASYWGYRSLNGPAAQTIAALKKYGLMEDEGASDDRKARLTRLADVILMSPDEASKKEAIREAALRPAMHQEMWDKYGNHLPTDDSLLWELTRDRGFTETGATEFLREYRATIAFAQLGSGHPALEPPVTDDAALEAEDAPAGDDGRRGEPERPSTQQRRQAGEAAKSYAIPLIDNGSIEVQGQFPITERDWKQFIDVLTVMKPGLVAVSPDEGS